MTENSLETSSDKLNSFRLPQVNQTCKFQFEQGGMLVYDVKASIFKISESIFPTTFPSISYRTKESEHPGTEVQPSEDNELLLKVKNMQAMPDFQVFYNLFIPDDEITLQFNSKFESGNLLKSVKLSDYEYNLIVRSDIHSTGNNHWFYFSVYNPRKTSVKFNLVNMKKNDGLYKLGMKPAVYSTKSYQQSSQGWHRDGSNISYKPQSSSETFFTLSFTYSFKHVADLVYFAYSVPYTYSALQEYLQNIKETHSDKLRIDKLCDSLAGNSCDILTITSDISSYISHKEETTGFSVTLAGLKNVKRAKPKLRYLTQHKHKKGVFFTARVHSGETVSSFTVQGVIDFLLGDSIRAKLLREQFVFKIIPMLNPDGVRYGNYRCSLLGVDLNRRWDAPSRQMHPTVFHAKKMLTVFSERHPVSLFCDFHGHTKKQNIFMYGCHKEHPDLQGKRENLCIKVLPVLMESNKFFSFKNCHFRIEPSKLSTARVVVFKELKILNSYTLESSFFGPKASEYFSDSYQMETRDYSSIGETICEILPVFLSEKLFYQKLKYVSEYLTSPAQSFPSQGALIDLQEVTKDLSESNPVSEISETQWDMVKLPEDKHEEDSGGSESSPDERTEKRSKSSVKARVSYQKLYKQKGKEILLNDLKPNYRYKNFNGSIRKEILGKSERAKAEFSNESDRGRNGNVPNSFLRKAEIRFQSNKRDVIVRDWGKGSELPKINSDPKGGIKISPRGYNFINFSWVEEYSHKIASSANRGLLLSRNTVLN